MHNIDLPSRYKVAKPCLKARMARKGSVPSSILFNAHHNNMPYKRKVWILIWDGMTAVHVIGAIFINTYSEFVEYVLLLKETLLKVIGSCVIEACDLEPYL